MGWRGLGEITLIACGWSDAPSLAAPSFGKVFCQQKVLQVRSIKWRSGPSSSKVSVVKLNFSHFLLVYKKQRVFFLHLASNYYNFALLSNIFNVNKNEAHRMWEIVDRPWLRKEVRGSELKAFGCKKKTLSPWHCFCLLTHFPLLEVATRDSC